MNKGWHDQFFRGREEQRREGHNNGKRGEKDGEMKNRRSEGGKSEKGEGEREHRVERERGNMEYKRGQERGTLRVTDLPPIMPYLVLAMYDWRF